MSAELFNSALAQDGFFFLCAAAFTAGLVRGFSGFGTAMVFLPVAGQFLPPITALTVCAIMDFFGPLVLIPRLAKDIRFSELWRLVLAMALVFPFALWALSKSDPDLFRYLVSCVALVLLICLVMGIRYRRKVTPRLLFGIGASSGITGGFVGMPGPPVIFFYLAGPFQAAAVRANTLVFLFSYEILFLLVTAVSGFLTLQNLTLGLVLALPVISGNLIGAYFFNPERETLYRRVAFCIIFLSAINGLPLLD